MSKARARNIAAWQKLGTRFLPLSEQTVQGLPWPRLLRLSLLQVSVGMALVLLTGTLNRVMIIELGVAAKVVAALVALPVLFAPARLLVGYRSDHHRSVLGWRRIPYIWLGTLAAFGGFAIMPFALLILSGDTRGPLWVGDVSAAAAFLLVGMGMHTTQTAGLALANDVVEASARPRVVAVLYVMLLSGMVASAGLFGWLLADFSQLRLIQVIQGAALVTVALNIVALWRQESFRRQTPLAEEPAAPSFAAVWRRFASQGRMPRFLVAVALGSVAFAMQDILLEPYGGEILGLSVGATTALTALSACGALLAFLFAAWRLAGGANPNRLSAAGALVGIAAFSCVVFAAPLGSATCFRFGTVLIGFGGGLFCIGTLMTAMTLREASTDSEADAMNGFALGAWGAVHAGAVGVGIAVGGVLRDVVSALAVQGRLGPALTDPVVGYTMVYHIEILFLFAMLVVIGPLVSVGNPVGSFVPDRDFRLTEFPGV